MVIDSENLSRNSRLPKYQFDISMRYTHEEEECVRVVDSVRRS